jgi:sugar phosphate isomerase/epimerase
MSKVFVTSLWTDSFNPVLSYARENQHNFEIQIFGSPRVLDTNLQEILTDYQQKLKPFKGIISIHGPFEDLKLHSVDRRIGELTKQRYIQALDIAKELKASMVLFHGNFSSLARDESERQWGIRRNVEFISEILNKYNFTVLLENVWEKTPQIFRTFLDEIKSPRLKICIDMGHLNVWADAPIDEWISVLGDDIRYMHVHDNKGDYDSHSVPGEGNINWQNFSSIIVKNKIEPFIVLEVVGVEKTRKADNFLRENNIYPYNL